MSRKSFDPEMVARTLRLIHNSGSVIEIRMPKSGRLRTISGYFNNVDALVKVVTPVPRDLLQALAEMAPKPQASPPPTRVAHA
jgi:hypothetical protein